MNKAQIFSIGLRLTGLYLILEFVSALPYMLPNLVSDYEVYGFGPYLYEALQLLFGLILFLKPNIISERVYKDKNSTNISKEDIVTFFIGYTGFTLLFYLVLRFFMMIATYLPTNFSMVEEAFRTFFIPLNIFELIIGVLLLLKAPQISHLLYNKILKRFWG